MNPTELSDNLDDVVTHELGLLEALESALGVEADAVRKLDYATIDEVRKIKEHLDADLRAAQAARKTAAGSLNDDLRARYRVTAGRVRETCDLNNQLLRVTLRTVEGLVAALTGADSKGYGAKNVYAKSTNVSAILTSSIG